MTYLWFGRITVIMHKKSDLQLVRESLGGDQEAFRLLVERTQDMVYRVAYRFLRDIHEAEDVVQEVYVKVWKNLHTYRDSAKLTTWMFTITSRMCLDILKSARKKQVTESLQENTTVDYPDLEMDHQELKERIVAASEKLTPKQKAVFVLRDLEGLSVDNTCEILSMKEGQVKSNLYYARKRIHAIVSSEYKIKNHEM